MLPDELACLYGRRYLSDEYMSWVIQKLNSMQFDVLCIYRNFVADIEHFCERQVESSQYKKLLFIFNVGYTKLSLPFHAQRIMGSIVNYNVFESHTKK